MRNTLYILDNTDTLFTSKLSIPNHRLQLFTFINYIVKIVSYCFSVVAVLQTLSEATYDVLVDAEDQAGNQASDSTSDELTVDITLPTLTLVSIVSNNGNDTTLAKVGDVVTLSFTSNENIQTPNVTIAGNSAVVSDGPITWNAEYTMAGTETEGVVALVIGFTDLAGNSGIEVTAITEGSNVTFDKTAPTGYSASVDQSYINNSNKTVLSFTFAGAEVDATYNYSIDDTNAGTTAVVGSGTVVGATDQIMNIDVSLLDDDTLEFKCFNDDGDADWITIRKSFYNKELDYQDLLIKECKKWR